MKKKDNYRWPVYYCSNCGYSTTWNKNNKCRCGGDLKFKVMEIPLELEEKTKRIVEETRKLRGFSGMF